MAYEDHGNLHMEGPPLSLLTLDAMFSTPCFLDSGADQVKGSIPPDKSASFMIQ